jgi:hypothetical protein
MATMVDVLKKVGRSEAGNRIVADWMKGQNEEIRVTLRASPERRYFAPMLGSLKPCKVWTDEQEMWSNMGRRVFKGQSGLSPIRDLVFQYGFRKDEGEGQARDIGLWIDWRSGEARNAVRSAVTCRGVEFGERVRALGQAFHVWVKGEKGEGDWSCSSFTRDDSTSLVELLRGRCWVSIGLIVRDQEALRLDSRFYRLVDETWTRLAPVHKLLTSLSRARVRKENRDERHRNVKFAAAMEEAQRWAREPGRFLDLGQQIARRERACGRHRHLLEGLDRALRRHGFETQFGRGDLAKADVLASKGRRKILAEVKSVEGGDFRGAVRYGLAQLLEYGHVLASSEERSSRFELALVLGKPLPDDLGFLRGLLEEDLGIGLAWQDLDRSLLVCGPKTARRFGWLFRRVDV